MQAYTIKPIDWQPGTEPGVIEAKTPLGLLCITELASDRFLLYCAGVEYHDFESQEAAKRMAWRHYSEQMKTGLIPFN